MGTGKFFIFLCPVVAVVLYWVIVVVFVYYLTGLFPQQTALPYCTFFLFFFNIFLGVISCLKRVIIGAVLGVMFLGRTQKSVLSRDFELMDPGLTNNSYLKSRGVIKDYVKSLYSGESVTSPLHSELLQR